MSYDLVLVGAGLTSASIAASLKGKYKILVLENRPYIGGNCHDFKSMGTYIHRHGPHIFHTSNEKITNFLAKYTEWVPYTHTVTAEIDDSGIKKVSFPYSEQCRKEIGRELSQEDIINIFFRGYSKKMWNIDYSNLPESIKNRVPKDTKDVPKYYREQNQFLPKYGYTSMIENMLDGCEIILGADQNDWKMFNCRTVYCGRPDLLTEKKLKYRSLKIDFNSENNGMNTAQLNICHLKDPRTRRVSYKLLTGGSSNISTSETPYETSDTDLNPYYPMPKKESDYIEIKNEILSKHPNLILAGRSGLAKYINMDGAVASALSLADKLQ